MRHYPLAAGSSRWKNAGGIVSKSRNVTLSGERLPELNAKMSQLVELVLKRALLKDYQNLAGIFILRCGRSIKLPNDAWQRRGPNRFQRSLEPLGESSVSKAA